MDNDVFASAFALIDQLQKLEGGFREALRVAQPERLVAQVQYLKEQIKEYQETYNEAIAERQQAWDERQEMSDMLRFLVRLVLADNHGAARHLALAIEADRRFNEVSDRHEDHAALRADLVAKLEVALAKARATT